LSQVLCLKLDKSMTKLRLV